MCCVVPECAKHEIGDVSWAGNQNTDPHELQPASLLTKAHVLRNCAMEAGSSLLLWTRYMLLERWTRCLRRRPAGVLGSPFRGARMVEAKIKATERLEMMTNGPFIIMYPILASYVPNVPSPAATRVAAMSFPASDIRPTTIKSQPQIHGEMHLKRQTHAAPITPPEKPTTAERAETSRQAKGISRGVSCVRQHTNHRTFMAPSLSTPSSPW
jgi:hypothetical protein